jgi:hypothetical protein
VPKVPVRNDGGLRPREIVRHERHERHGPCCVGTWAMTLAMTLPSLSGGERHHDRHSGRGRATRGRPGDGPIR